MTSLIKKKQKLRDYIWGLGLEHEMHLFHKPKYSSKNITDFILYDGQSALIRLLEKINKGKIKLNNDDFEYILSVPFETTGRKCNGKWVIKKVPCNMPEFITDYPINNLLNGRNMTNMCQELILNKKIFIDSIKKDSKTKKQIEKYGKLVQYPFSMISYLKYPENANSGIYKFKKTKGTKKDSVRQEYVGSYHITISLPYKKFITTKKDFIKEHQNFANQLQWLEPLLLTAFFSCDQKAPGSNYKRIRGSFRVMMIGWGNLAGSDVRKFGEGIGRYTNIETYWRKGLKFYEIEKLKPCYDPSPAAKRENGTTTLSSDFRTFGSTDPDRPEHRASGAGMTVGNGIEFRIFDHFNDQILPDLCKFVSFVAENSRNHKTKSYVYKNKHWIDAVHSIMEDGWCAKIKKGYINELRKTLGLKIDTSSRIAYDILDCINEELYSKHKNGDYVIIMNYEQWKKSKLLSKNKKHSSVYKPLKPLLPKVNLYSWIMGLMIKLNRNSTNMKNFNNLVNVLPNNLDYKEFESYFFRYFNKKYWKKDPFNFAYFLKFLNFVKLTLNKNGSIKSIKKNNYLIEKVRNFNKEIIEMFSDYRISGFNSINI